MIKVLEAIELFPKYFILGNNDEIDIRLNITEIGMLALGTNYYTIGNEGHVVFNMSDCFLKLSWPVADVYNLHSAGMFSDV